MSNQFIYAINYNFDVMFKRLNELYPKMESFQKFVKREKKFDSNILWLFMAAFVCIYIDNERAERQRKEIEKLKKEVDQLKGEQMMR